MNINLAIGLFFLVTLAYMVLIEIFTILFRLTGLTQEKARFQVISLLTTSGFTTRESEIMLATINRRKLSGRIMIVGYVFSVLIVSLIINLALTIPQSKASDYGVITILISAAFVLLLVVFSLKPVRGWFAHLIENLARRALYGDKTKIVILDFYHSHIIAQVFIRDLPPQLEGKTLAESDIKNKFDVQILLITREGATLPDIKSGEILRSGDVLTVYANAKKLNELFCMGECDA